MLTFHATEQINEVSRTTTQVITRYFGRWPQTKRNKYLALLTFSGTREKLGKIVLFSERPSTVFASACTRLTHIYTLINFDLQNDEYIKTIYLF